MRLSEYYLFLGLEIEKIEDCIGSNYYWQQEKLKKYTT